MVCAMRTLNQSRDSGWWELTLYKVFERIVVVVSGGVARRTEDRFFRRRRSSSCLFAVFSEHWQFGKGGWGVGRGQYLGPSPAVFEYCLEGETWVHPQMARQK